MAKLFTKTLDTKAGAKEFFFEEVLYSDLNFRNSTTKYHVRVNDENGKPIELVLFPNDSGTWKILAQQLPDWIWDLELELGDIIDASNA